MGITYKGNYFCCDNDDVEDVLRWLDEFERAVNVKADEQARIARLEQAVALREAAQVRAQIRELQARAKYAKRFNRAKETQS